MTEIILIALGLLCLNMILLMIIWRRTRLVEQMLKKVLDVVEMEKGILDDNLALGDIKRQTEVKEEKVESDKIVNESEGDVIALEMQKQEELINEVLSEIFC